MSTEDPYRFTAEGGVSEIDSDLLVNKIIGSVGITNTSCHGVGISCAHRNTKL